jgi:hypothetical protein
MATEKRRAKLEIGKMIVTQIMGTLIVLFVFDLVFIFTEIRVWTSTDSNNPIWQTIRPLHNFGIFCFILINILKIILTVLVGKGISEANKTVQTR